MLGRVPPSTLFYGRRKSPYRPRQDAQSTFRYREKTLWCWGFAMVGWLGIAGWWSGRAKNCQQGWWCWQGGYLSDIPTTRPSQLTRHLQSPWHPGHPRLLLAIPKHSSYVRKYYRCKKKNIRTLKRQYTQENVSLHLKMWSGWWAVWGGQQSHLRWLKFLYM